MSQQIQIRRDTSTNWTNTNPTLAQGEWGYEIDSGKVKIGTGSASWNSLDYFGAGQNNVGVNLGSGEGIYTTNSGVYLQFKSLVAGDNISLISDGTTITISGAATTASGSGVSDHGLLTGLLDDDHTQYLTTGRGDARYYTQAQVDTISGSLQTEIDNITISGTNVNLGYIDFDTTLSGIAYKEGRLYWDADAKTLSIGTDLVDVSLLIGQEQQVRAINTSGLTIAKGDLVYITGAQEGMPTIALADAASVTSRSTIGFATEIIYDTEIGHVTTFGLVRGLNTTGASAGNVLWLASDGGWTNEIPDPSVLNVLVGVCLTSHATEGIIFAKIYPVPSFLNLIDTPDSYPDDPNWILRATASGIERYNITGHNHLIHVAEDYGSPDGDGSVLFPLDTINNAIEYIKTTYSGSSFFYAIQLEAGVHYADSITVDTPLITVINSTNPSSTFIKPASATPNSFINLPYNTSIKNVTIDATNYPSLMTASGSIGINVLDDSYEQVNLDTVFLKGFRTCLYTDVVSNIYMNDCDIRQAGTAVKVGNGALFDSDVLFIEDCWDKHVHITSGAEAYLADVEICSTNTLSGTGLYVEGADTYVELFGGTNIWGCDKDIVVKDTSTVRVDNCVLEPSESFPTIQQLDTATLIIINSRAPLGSEALEVNNPDTVYINAYDADNEITVIGKGTDADQALFEVHVGGDNRPGLFYESSHHGSKALSYRSNTNGENTEFYASGLNARGAIGAYSTGPSGEDYEARIEIKSYNGTRYRGWDITKASGTYPDLIFEALNQYPADPNTVMTLTHSGSVKFHEGVYIDKVLDEDNFASDDPMALATQQSIKAYITSQRTTFSGMMQAQVDELDSKVLYQDGTKPLTADWNAGDYRIASDGFDKDNMEIDLGAYAAYTGIISGGDVTINSGDPSYLDVASGTALYFDMSNPASPIIETLSWNDMTVYGGISGTTTHWAGIYRSAPGVGSFIHQESFSSEESRTIATLARYWTVSGDTIVAAPNYKTPAYGVGNAFHDITYALGSLNISGNKFTASSTAMKLDRSAGESFRYNGNFGNNPQDPNLITSTAETPVTAYRYTVQGAPSQTLLTEIDPDTYDVAGVETSVPAGKWTVQRLYCYPGSNIVVLHYGQAYYDTKAQATDGIATESPVINTAILAGAVLRAYVVVKQGATDLTDTDQAVIKEAYSDPGLVDGITHHGDLGGLLDDDHTQYHTDARGDARYYTQSQIDTLSGTLSQSSNISYTNTNWTITDVQDALDKLTDYVENTNGTGRIAPIGTTMSGFLGPTLYVEAGEGYINHDGLHKYISWSADTIDITSFDGTYYLYVDANGDLLTSSTYPGRTDVILLGFFYVVNSVIGLTQTGGCVIDSYYNRVVDFIFNLGTFLTSDNGLVQVAEGADKTRVVSPACTAQYGTIQITLPERSSDDAATVNFICVYLYNDQTMDSLDYFSSPVGYNGSIPTNIWNDMSYPGIITLSGTYTFTQYSPIVTVSGTISDLDVGDFIWLEAEGVTNFQTPVTTISGSVVTLETIYAGTGGTGVALANKSLKIVPEGKWIKHLIGRTLDGNMQLVLSQNYFDSEDAALAVGSPIIPAAIEQANVKMAYVVCSGTGTDLTNGLIDIRPLPFHVREGGGQSGGGASDHGALTGLLDDDHTQYILADGSRNFGAKVKYTSHPTFTANTEIVDKQYVDSKQFDHGGLAGLADDDHTQYLNTTRGDARYYTETELNNGQLDTRYYTETELDNGQLDNRYYTETELNAGQLDNRYYTESEVDTISGSLVAQMITDHGALTGLSDDDHTQYHTDARGDIRYYTKTQLNAGQLDTRYYTEAEIDATLSGTTPITVKDEGGDVANTPHTALNFTGAGVTVSDGGSGVATINIPAASGGIIIEDESTTVSGGPHNIINFTGQMVTATDAGGGRVTVDIPYQTFGTWYGWAVDDTTTSTNSVTYQQKLRYTTPSLAAGYYRVGWYCEYNRDSSNTDIMIRIQVDDTTTIMQINQELNDITNWLANGGSCVVQLTAAAHTIDLDFAAESTAGTSYIRRARLEMWRVA